MTSWRRTTVHLKKYVFFNSQLRLKLRKNVELFDSPLPRTGLRVPVRVDVRGRRARHGALGRCRVDARGASYESGFQTVTVDCAQVRSSKREQNMSPGSMIRPPASDIPDIVGRVPCACVCHRSRG